MKRTLPRVVASLIFAVAAVVLPLVGQMDMGLLAFGISLVIYNPWMNLWK